MVSALTNYSFVQHKDLIRPDDRVKTMRNDNHRLVFHQCIQRPMNLFLIVCIQTGSGFIQQDDRCILDESACNGNSLLLAAGERIAAFAHHGFIAVRQCRNKLVALCRLCRCNDFLHSCARLSNADIVRYGIMQQINVLKDDGHFLGQCIR